MTAAQEWEFFEQQTLQEGASRTQRREMKRAFYSGMLVCIPKLIGEEASSYHPLYLEVWEELRQMIQDDFLRTSREQL